MGRQLGGFCNDCHIGVDHMPTSSRETLDHTRQQNSAVRVLPLRILIGKMLPDITVRYSTQKRVAQRVDQHVSVRVTLKAALVRNLDSAE
jgi:hypothetical protein